MVNLYNSVDCLFFPSYYEGFGRPPLEAMSCGLPVISSNIASLPEVLGDSGLLSHPNDVEAFYINILSIIENIDKKNKMITSGLVRAKLFNWKKNMEKTIEIYKSVLNK